MDAWMIYYPHVSPDLFSIGPFDLRWYGLMYVLAFLDVYFAIKYQENGGMSFYGGLIGKAIAGWSFSRRKKIPFRALADRVIVTVPIGFGLGRIGNFINDELYGRPSDLPWAMVFPGGGPLARYPSQLYEAFLEWLVLFLVLLWLSKKKMPDGFLLGIFLIGYGLFRFLLEFLREPDSQLGLILGPFTMRQTISATMIFIGALNATLQYK